MRLVIGGRYNGKLNYVMEKYHYSENDIINGNEINIHKPQYKKVINNYHLFIKKLLENNIDSIKITTEVLKNSNIQTIICDELGGGIVPLDEFDRIYIDTVGICCQIISKHSSSVERIYFGIPLIIK
jgi:Adenosyl cobinamide kinase/adenosyl cobinamide phosphate guanylyltransferase